MSTEDAGQYRCLVNLCPMIGGIFLAGPQAPGICAYHYGATGHDITRITQLLLDWECVTYEINRWRRALLSVDVDKSALVKAWTRLQPSLGGNWGAELGPAAGESYVQWGQKLERFMDSRLRDTINQRAARPAS